jgi:hypothetical protein
MDRDSWFQDIDRHIDDGWQRVEEEERQQIEADEAVEDYQRRKYENKS